MKSVHFHGAWLGHVLGALSFFGAAFGSAAVEPFRGVRWTTEYNSRGQTGLGAGQNSCGRAAPAAAIQPRLLKDGTDVTTAVVVRL